MRRLAVLFMLLLFLSSCQAVTQSLYEPVNPEDKTMYTIEVKEGESLSELAKELSEKKIISHAMALKQYMKEQGLSESLQSGRFELGPSMSLQEIAARITEVHERDVVSITFPEGIELKEIIHRLQEKGLAKDEKHFRQVLKEGEFPYAFLKEVDRSHDLEGFLFPDTYEFYIDSSDEEIIDKMLSNFDAKFDHASQARMKELGLSLQDLMTLASIIEREAQIEREFPIVSSVFHNRLAIKMPLQACSTVQYLLGERKPVLTYDDIAIESPYNTYLVGGLPPGPIASPSLKAIKAALYPADTRYLYFVTQESGDGSHYFAETLEEHQKNVEIGLPNAPEKE